MSIFCIGGEPACGKSSVVRQWMFQFDWDLEETRLYGLLHGIYSSDINTYVLGKHYLSSCEKFPGTDKLSMLLKMILYLG